MPVAYNCSLSAFCNAQEPLRCPGGAVLAGLAITGDLADGVHSRPHPKGSPGLSAPLRCASRSSRCRVCSTHYSMCRIGGRLNAGVEDVWAGWGRGQHRRQNHTLGRRTEPAREARSRTRISKLKVPLQPKIWRNFTPFGEFFPMRAGSRNGFEIKFRPKIS